MSTYYKPDRNSNWNYGGPNWRLSRSKIGLFCECARCFYIDNKLGTARPPGFPFNLNSAVDALFKKEFDVHRSNRTKHPLMNAYGLDLVPFKHPKMDVWREVFKGIDYLHTDTAMTICGAVDDIWEGKSGELHIVDYKSTSKDGKIDALDEDWHRGYKQQMEVYQWLFRKNGFTVSNTGYFVYANATKDKEAFDGKLEFEVTVIPYDGETTWLDETLVHIKDCLEKDDIPVANPDCDYCRYREMAGKKLQARHKQLSEKQTKMLI